jgi:hypothetical protein
MSVDKQAAREWLARLQNVLNTIWDPIGGCPTDEYDTFVMKIASMVRDGASDDLIREYLRWSEAEHMGLGEPSATRLDQTMIAIRALGPIATGSH